MEGQSEKGGRSIMRTIPGILAQGGYVSGEAISRELGISRAAVWKKINLLKEQGWMIESAGRKGYRLTETDRLEPELWTDLLTTRALGRGDSRCLSVTDSTNLQLKQMAVAGAPEGSLCVSEQQTAGRGRLGRAWNSPSGQGLWVSVLLRPQLPPAQAPLITLCTAMAMARAVRKTTGTDIRIKWPNDLVLNEKKICGILLEISADPDRIEYVVIGTGLNVRKGAYPAELAHQATSIGECCVPPDRRVILAEYLNALEELTDRLIAGGFGAIAEEYRNSSCTIGSRVKVSGSINMTGLAEDVDETGALLVRGDDGVLTRVLSGDVSVRGVMGYV